MKPSEELRLLANSCRNAEARPVTSEDAAFLKGQIHGLANWAEALAWRVEQLEKTGKAPRYEPPEDTPLHPDDDPGRKDALHELELEERRIDEMRRL